MVAIEGCSTIHSTTIIYAKMAGASCGYYEWCTTAGLRTSNDARWRMTK